MNAETRKLLDGLAQEMAAAGLKVPAYDFGSPAPCYLPEMICETVERYQGGGKFKRVIVCYFVRGNFPVVTFGLN